MELYQRVNVYNHYTAPDVPQANISTYNTCTFKLYHCYAKFIIDFSIYLNGYLQISEEKKEIVSNLYVSGIPEEFIALQLDLEIPTVISILRERNLYQQKA